jgi:hypothetical protein
MKTLKTLSVIALAVFTCSFAPTKKFEDGYFKKGDVITFPKKKQPGEILKAASLKIGSYDGFRYTLEIDSNDNCTLSDWRKSDGEKQDELTLVGCSGLMKYDGEVLTVDIESVDKKYFLVNLDNETIIELDEKPKQIRLVSRDLNGNKAEFRSIQIAESKWVVNVMTLPLGVNSKQLFVAKHAKKTIAHFKEVKIEGDKGKQFVFPSGSYLLCGGSSFTKK